MSATEAGVIPSGAFFFAERGIFPCSALSREHVLKGRGFSRAARSRIKSGALAPEGGPIYFPPACAVAVLSARISSASRGNKNCPAASSITFTWQV